MDIYGRIDRENRQVIWKISFSVVIMVLTGYFLYLLFIQGFFVDWELYFASGCYISIIIMLTVLGLNEIRRIYYRIYIEDGKLKIRDGLFFRIISIPLERLYYIGSIKLDRKNYYESIFVTDKKINHKKINSLEEQTFKGRKEHLDGLRKLMDLYQGKKFYYYRICHNRYIFYYFFYLIYRNCDNCKFSDTTMSMVKRYVEGK